MVQSFIGKLAVYFVKTSKVVLDNEMDGESLCTLFESSPGPDCLKDIVPKLGPRLRMYKEIKDTFLSNSSVVS